MLDEEKGWMGCNSIILAYFLEGRKLSTMGRQTDGRAKGNASRMFIGFIGEAYFSWCIH